MVHFCGHRISRRRAADASAERQAIAGAIGDELDRCSRRIAYGSLASGADILWAEALLAAGAELHVVLPFAREEFVRTRSRPPAAAGSSASTRCLARRATVVSYATDDAFLGDDVLYRYGTELAMGLALLRARFLDAEVRQLAVWDGGPAHGDAGTAIDVATWRRGGRAVTIVSADRPRATRRHAEPATRRRRRHAAGRVAAARRARDAVRRRQGFSKLTDEQTPGSPSACWARSRTCWRARTTCGTATRGATRVYVVLADAVCAAACALELQAAMAAIDLACRRACRATSRCDSAGPPRPGVPDPRPGARRRERSWDRT